MNNKTTLLFFVVSFFNHNFIFAPKRNLVTAFFGSAKDAVTKKHRREYSYEEKFRDMSILAVLDTLPDSYTSCWMQSHLHNKSGAVKNIEVPGVLCFIEEIVKKINKIISFLVCFKNDDFVFVQTKEFINMNEIFLKKFIIGNVVLISDCEFVNNITLKLYELIMDKINSSI